ASKSDPRSARSRKRLPIRLRHRNAHHRQSQRLPDSIHSHHHCLLRRSQQHPAPSRRHPLLQAHLALPQHIAPSPARCSTQPPCPPPLRRSAEPHSNVIQNPFLH